MNSDSSDNEPSAWRRVGAAVRDARTALGYSSRDAFAVICDVSVRVLADLEGGTRTNFSNRVLAHIESGLGWPEGTVDQMIADPQFTPPAPGHSSDELVFHPPNYDRRPITVEVSVVEKSISTLTEVRRELGDEPPQGAVAALGSSLIAHCAPYVIRLLEDNCLPGRELHPAVRPLYELFTQLVKWTHPTYPSLSYMRWLTGDASEPNEATRDRFMSRWAESRRAPRGRAETAQARTR